MSDLYKKYEMLIEKILSYASENADIRAVLIVGSRARISTPADEWSDLDLVIFSKNANYYLTSSDWLEKIAEYWITFIEQTAVGGGRERRVLFAEGLDVDFSFFPVDMADELLKNPEVQSVLKRGIHVLIDKDNLFNTLSIVIMEQPTDVSLKLPSKDEYNNLVNDFWYHVVWGGKKLLRGEIWIAKSNVDNYLKRQLLRMVEWHTKVKNNKTYDTWHDGRFFDKWADPRIIESLYDSFAYYNRQDIVRATIKTMELFRWVAREVSEGFKYPYPIIADKKATRWYLSNLLTKDGNDYEK